MEVRDNLGSCRTIQIDVAQLLLSPVRTLIFKVMSATYGYNTKPAVREAGGVAYDRVVSNADEDVEAMEEPKEIV